jgi:hypothetical protein
MRLAIAIGASAVILGSALAQTVSDREDSGSTQRLIVSRHGWIDLSGGGCSPGLCASIGDPYRYSVFSPDDITKAAVDAVQDFGFSYHVGVHAPTFPECKREQEQFKDTSFFWTDYVPLNEKFITKFSLNWDDLNITPNNDIFYQLRIVGCYHNINDGESVAVAHPYVMEGQNLSLDTSMNLILRIDIQYRGRKSAFIDGPKSIYPKSILDTISKNITKSVDKIEPNHYKVEKLRDKKT